MVALFREHCKGSEVFLLIQEPLGKDFGIGHDPEVRPNAG